MAARGGGRGPRRGPGGLEAENKFKVSYDPKPTYPVSQQKYCHGNLFLFILLVYTSLLSFLPSPSHLSPLFITPSFVHRIVHRTIRHHA